MNRTALKPRPPVPAGRIARRSLTALALLAPVIAATLSGCSTSSSTANGAPSPTETSVNVGTKTNSLPTPPAQTTTNRYAGLDVVSNGNSWNWTVSQPNETYSYQQQLGPSASANGNSFGVVANVGDFEFFSDTFYVPFGAYGLSAEIPSGVSLFEPANGGFPLGPLVVGVPEQSSSCLAPDGQVAIDFVAVPPPPGSGAAPATDTLYGQTTLGYKSGQFTYSGTTQLATGGAAATTLGIPFANSYCVQAGSGYAIQSSTLASGTSATLAGSTSSNVLAYIGSTGTVVGDTTAITTATDVSGNVNTTTGHTGFIGAIEPSAPIDLAMVTAGTYRGFNASTSVNPDDPAYFGQGSAFVSGPALTQTPTSLVGGFVDYITNFTFSTTPQPVTPADGHDALIDFGTQDPKHNGLFPNASFTQQDPSNACPAAQQTTVSGLAYCTFPVVALVSQSYGKFAFFVVGPEQTSGTQLFYALVQD